MDVKGKGVRVWRKDIEGKNGTFYLYSVSVSNKKEDGSYTNKYMPIKFAKNANMPEKISNGAKCDFSGFLSVDERPDKDGNKVTEFVIVAMSASLTDGGDPTEGVDSFAEAETDIPF